MDAVLKNHLAIIKAQSTFLHRELKKCRQNKPLFTTNGLPQSLQQRLLPTENLHNVRIIDNFEITILYVLDKDGRIREKNRLETFMVLMLNTADDYMDRRILCLHLLHHCVSDAMKACFMDSGGLCLLHSWIQDIADTGADAAKHLDFVLLLVKLIGALPAIALAERNCGKIFFDKAMMPLATAVKIKALKKSSNATTSFSNEYRLLTYEYARVHKEICDKEAQERARLEQAAVEAEARAAALRLAEAEAAAAAGGIVVEIVDNDDDAEDSRKTRTPRSPTAAPVPQSSSAMVVDDEMDDIEMFFGHGSGSFDDDNDFTSLLRESPRPTPAGEAAPPAGEVQPDSSFKSTQPSTITTTFSSLEALDGLAPSPSLQRSSSSPISSAAGAPTTPRLSWGSSAMARQLAQTKPPPLPPQPYDYRSENNVLKSILKKSTKTTNDLDSLLSTDNNLSTAPKKISFGEPSSLSSTCSWYGGKDCYYQWMRPAPRPSASTTEALKVVSCERQLQEQRLLSATEFLMGAASGPDDPAMADVLLLQARRQGLEGGAKAIPWDNGAGGGQQQEEDVEDSVVGDGDTAGDGIRPSETIVQTVRHFKIERTVPNLNTLRRNDPNNIYIAIWNHVAHMIGTPGKLMIQLCQIGTELSSKFGKKYLSRCSGHNLKGVLLSHPEEKFVLDERFFVGMRLVLADVWDKVKGLCEDRAQEELRLAEAVVKLVEAFGPRYLHLVQKASLVQALESHPLAIFDVYQSTQSGRNAYLAIRLRGSTEQAGREHEQVVDLTPTLSPLPTAAPQLDEGVDNRPPSQALTHVPSSDNVIGVEDREDDAGRESRTDGDDGRAMVSMDHMSKIIKAGGDPYESMWLQDSDDDDDDSGSQATVARRKEEEEGPLGTRDDEGRRGGGAADVFRDEALRETLLCTFVEQVKTRGIAGLRKSQIDASLLQLFRRVTNRFADEDSESARAIGDARDALLRAVTRRFPHVYVQEQHPSKNHCVYYIDNPCVSRKNWKREVSCIFLPQGNNLRCQQTGCEFAHHKVYDVQERGFSDSSSKRQLGLEVLRQQVLTVIREAEGVVFNFDVFERYYKKFGSRLCFGDRVTICTEAEALRQLLADCPEVRVFTDPRCVGFKVMGYTWVRGAAGAAEPPRKRRRSEQELDEEAEVLGRTRDRLLKLIKDCGKQGIPLADIPRCYQDKYGERLRFTVEGEVDLDLESIVEVLPGVKKETPVRDDGHMEELSSKWGFGAGEASWGHAGSSSSSSSRSHVQPRGRDDGSDAVYYYDDNVSYVDEDGCLDLSAVGKMSKSDNYHAVQAAKRVKRELSDSRRHSEASFRGDSINRSRAFGSRDHEDYGDRYGWDEGRGRDRDRDRDRRVDYYDGSGSLHVLGRIGSHDDSPPRESSGGALSPRRQALGWQQRAKEQKSPKSNSASVCAYFNSPRGCWRGGDCKFLHEK